ncbi:MAG TPA: septal ring lytic transglycosylase RlpA family protein [Polyangia bacterium]|nr:septal ring lytic transglycosylase RlpA family protein [Polyangia bacterium]
MNVHAETHARGLAARRTAALIAVAAVAGISVALGCASEASARRGAPAVGHVQKGRASYYGKEFVGRRTASGERYDPKLMTAAHKTLPLGTRIRVTRPGGASVVVRVNDRCGCTHGRIVDVSEEAARQLDMLRAGVVQVRLEVIR